MPEKGTSPYLVFISHSGADLWVAQQISLHVERCGAQTFLDEAQIAVGADFDEEIRKALVPTSFWSC